MKGRRTVAGDDEAVGRVAAKRSSIAKRKELKAWGEKGNDGLMG